MHNLILTVQAVFITLLQIAAPAPVVIQVRYADSSSFTEPVQIRSDEGELLMTCEPDEAGRCTLQLSRGLYLVEPIGIGLDAVSAKAAVEIGGRWLGITIGDEPISYGFVVEGESLYFDETPDQVQVRPFRPKQADIEAHFAPKTPVPNSRDADPTIAPQTLETTPQPTSSADPQSSLLAWVLIPSFVIGLFMTWSLWTMRQSKQRPES